MSEMEFLARGLVGSAMFLAGTMLVCTGILSNAIRDHKAKPSPGKDAHE